MKRITVFLLVVVMMLSTTSCKSNNVQQASKHPSEKTAAVDKSLGSFLTMEEVAEANTVEKLLKRYETVTYSQLDFIGGDTMHITYFKDAAGVLRATGDDSGYTDYYNDNFRFWREDGMSHYEISAMKKIRYLVSDYKFIVDSGKFTSQTTDASGNLICVSESAISQDYADSLSESWKVTTKDKMVTTTVLSPNDLRVLTTEFSIAYAGGSTSKIAEGVLLCDKEVKYTDAVRSYLDAKKVTVTVVFENGNNRVFEIPKGERFTYECDKGYSLYLQPGGRVAYPIKSSALQENLTLYNLPQSRN